MEVEMPTNNPPVVTAPANGFQNQFACTFNENNNGAQSRPFPF